MVWNYPFKHTPPKKGVRKQVSSLPSFSNKFFVIYEHVVHMIKSLKQ